jgi:hypothetical protein
MIPTDICFQERYFVLTEESGLSPGPGRCNAHVRLVDIVLVRL